jgi:hypothetical protein
MAQSGLHLHQSEPYSCGNIQQTGYELRSNVNENSVFKVSFSCEQDWVAVRYIISLSF